MSQIPFPRLQGFSGKDHYTFEKLDAKEHESSSVSDIETDLTESKLDLIIKNFKENMEATLKESSDGLDIDASSSNGEDEDSPHKIRSNSCPVVPLLNPKETKMQLPSSSSTIQHRHVVQTEKRKQENNGSTTFLEKSTSAPSTKPRSSSMKATTASTLSTQPESQLTMANCQKTMLKRQELARKQEFKDEMKIVAIVFNYLDSLVPTANFYNPSQELIEKMTFELMKFNNKVFEEIDEELNKNGDYYEVTIQINSAYTLFCKNADFFYQEIQELHKMLSSDHTQIFVHEKAIDKKELCAQLATYLANEQQVIVAIRKLKDQLLNILTSEKKYELNSLIKKHIVNQYVLIKAYVQHLGEENIYLVKHGEKAWIKTNAHIGSQKISAQEVLAKIPYCLSLEKISFEDLHTKMNTRIKMRQHVPSIVEHFAQKMISGWITLIKKGKEKLESDEEKQ